MRLRRLKPIQAGLLVSALLILSSCSTPATRRAGTPFGSTVSERTLLLGIVDRLAEHGSFRFRWSGEVVDPVPGFENDPRVTPMSTQPAEGQARADLSRWWAARYPPATALPVRVGTAGWSMFARYERATATNSHYLERTCRLPFQRFTTDLCQLFFGDFSGLWRSDVSSRTLRQLAFEEADRDHPLRFRLVESTPDQPSDEPSGTAPQVRRFRYRAELPGSLDGNVDWIEYEVGLDRTLHVARRTYARTSQPGRVSVATTDLFGFGEPVALPVDPTPGER